MKSPLFAVSTTAVAQRRMGAMAPARENNRWVANQADSN